jgi:hypothetical protein
MPISAQIPADSAISGPGMIAGFDRRSRAAEFNAAFDLSHLALRIPA